MSLRGLIPRLVGRGPLHSSLVNIPRAYSSMTDHRVEDPIIFAPETYQYNKGHLGEKEVIDDPIEQFHQWFSDAQNSKPKDSEFLPESTTLSTARLPSGRVSSRTVLLKELDHSGFVIYSNWDTSKKLKDFDSNKFASLTFFWPYLQRQVRVEGIMEKVNAETSDRYFQSRPRGSKIGAWSSPQSRQLKSREELDDIVSENEKRFKDLKDADIPRPDFWGGVRIVPLEIEFWQGRPSRLHDRITFVREELHDKWKVTRIAP